MLKEKEQSLKEREIQLKKEEQNRKDEQQKLREKDQIIKLEEQRKKDKELKLREEEQNRKNIDLKVREEEQKKKEQKEQRKKYKEQKLKNREDAKLVEEVEGMKVELVERVDSYLEYVSNEWVEENTLQIEHGLRTEMTDSFLKGMMGLFEEHYVNIPEDKYDVVENMVGKLDEMEAKLNEQIEKNINITKSLSEATGGNILSDVSEGLSTSQKEKLASLAEGIEFESEESYKEKLETLKESYFKTAPKRSESEVLNEEAATPAPTGNMSAYLQALSHATKK